MISEIYSTKSLDHDESEGVLLIDLTVAIPSPSCVVPSRAFSANCLAANAVCPMARMARCVSSLLPSSVRIVLVDLSCLHLTETPTSSRPSWKRNQPVEVHSSDTIYPSFVSQKHDHILPSRLHLTGNTTAFKVESSDTIDNVIRATLLLVLHLTGMCPRLKSSIRIPST